MAALAASDVTVSITSTNIPGGSRQKIVHGTITFGDGSLTYPTAGVPLPAKENLGLIRNIDSFQIVGINAVTSDYKYEYNKSAHKLLMYEEEAVAAGGPLPECDTSEAPAARTLNFIAMGW